MTKSNKISHMDTIMSQTQSLPKWDLSDFYQNIDDPQIQIDLKNIKKDAESLAQTRGTIAKSSADELLKHIENFQALSQQLARIGSYAYLNFATHMLDEKVQAFQQRMDEFATDIYTLTVFFTHELNDIETTQLEKMYAENKNLATYKPWLDRVLAFKEFQLDLKLEEVLPQKDLTGCQAWVRLFDQTLAEMLFTDSSGKEMNLPQLLESMSNPKPEVRSEAASLLSKGLQDKKSMMTLIFNTLLKDKEVGDTLRGYNSPWHSRHIANNIEEEVVDAMVETVQANYHLCHRYYAWKAKQLGMDQLNYWDRNAPLTTEEEKPLPFDDARVIVLNAYRDFSQKLSEIGKKFFDNPWIDVPAYKGKTSGAFAHPTTPDVHPYLMLNYLGKRRDVMTLAHELGHGVHQYLANVQPYLLTHTPLTVAETASVFGEMLTFRALLKNAKNPAEKKALLAGKIEDMINTVFRQVAFHLFEREIHQKRKHGELSHDDFCDIWMRTQKEALGNAVKLDPLMQNYWGYISHFLHASFYVYAYAFGDCLVNALYSVYQSGHVENFEDKYLHMLSLGGSKHYSELLQPFNLNPKDKSFWQGGLDVIRGLIEELEALA